LELEAAVSVGFRVSLRVLFGLSILRVGFRVRVYLGSLKG
jgi:hypothetical protein